MALTDQEKAKAKQLKADGFTSYEIAAYLGSERDGRSSSSVHNEIQARSNLEQDFEKKQFSILDTASKFTDAIGLGGTTDVLGRSLTRTGLFTEDNQFTGQSGKELAQQFTEAPTRQEKIGAALQLGSTGAGFFITGGSSLLGQIAVGAGLGYLYDVGSDTIEGETIGEILDPDAATLVGGLLPIPLRGLQSLAGPASGAARETVEQVIPDNIVRETTEQVPTQMPEVVTGVAERAKEFGRRVPRALERGKEFAEEGAEIAKLRETATPNVQVALDEGIPLETIKITQSFDDKTRQAVVEMLDYADNPRGGVRPEIVPGRIAGEQYELIVKKRQNVGRQIEKASDELPTQTVEMLPTQRNLRQVLRENGIEPMQGGKLRFDNLKFTEQQQDIIQELYNLSTKSETLTPKQIHQLDSRFATLQREKRNELLDTVFVQVKASDGTVRNVNIFKVFRDVYGRTLDDLDGGKLRNINREYRYYRNLQDDLDNTIFKESKKLGVEVDPSERAAISMRRIFSNATSQPEFKKLYEQLDKTSRGLDYDGPNAEQLYEFYLRDMKPLYPETVAPTSFEGGIRGAVSQMVDYVTKVGAPNARDKQRALRGLVGAVDDVTPQAPKLKPDQETAVQSLGERVRESSTNDIPDYLKNNPQGGYLNVPISSKVTPESVAKLMDDKTFDAVTLMIEDLPTARMNPAVNRFLTDMKLDKASDDELLKFLKETTNEYENIRGTKKVQSA